MCHYTTYNDKKKCEDTSPCYEMSTLPAKFDRKVFDIRDIRQWVFRMQMSSWGKLVRASYLKRTGARFPEGFVPEDVSYQFEVMAPGARMTLVREKLYGHRINRRGSIWTQWPAHHFDNFRALRPLRAALQKSGVFELLCDEFYIWKYRWLVIWIFEIEAERQPEYSKKLIQEAKIDRKHVRSSLGERHWLSGVLDRLSRLKPEEIRYPVLRALLLAQSDPRKEP